MLVPLPDTQCVELVMSGRHEKETADLLTTQVSSTATPMQTRWSSVVGSILKNGLKFEVGRRHAHTVCADNCCVPLSPARQACDQQETQPRTFIYQLCSSCDTSQSVMLFLLPSAYFCRRRLQVFARLNTSISACLQEVSGLRPC